MMCFVSKRVPAVEIPFIADRKTDLLGKQEQKEKSQLKAFTFAVLQVEEMFLTPQTEAPQFESAKRVYGGPGMLIEREVIPFH